MSDYLNTTLKVEDVSFFEHESWIGRAEDGDTLAAKMLMSDASILIRHGVSLPEPLGSYIGEAFYNASKLNHALDLDRAFNLKGGDNLKRIKGSYQHLPTCAAVEYSRRECTSMAQAYARAGEMLNRNPERVGKNYSEHHEKWDLKSKSDEELLEIINEIPSITSG